MKKIFMRLPKAVSVLAGLLITALFFMVLTASSLLFAGMDGSESAHMYTYQMIGEAVAAVFAVLLAAAFGYLGVLREKGVGFGKSFYVGGFFVGYVVYVIVAQMLMSVLNPESRLEDFAGAAIFTVSMFLVGFTEEMIFRGVVFNLLFDRFSNTRRGVVLAVLLDGLIFGCAHFGNLTSGVKLSSVSIQVLSAGLLGAIFAAIYARSRNIWFVIAAHAAVDFGALLGGGIFGNGDLLSALNSYSSENLIAVPLLVVPLIILLRRSKMDEVVAKREGQQVVPAEKDASRDGVVSLVLGIISIVFSWMGMFFGIGIVGCVAAVSSKKAKHENNGIAVAGLVTSIVGTALGVLMAAALIAVMATADGVMRDMLMEQMGF